MRSLVLVVLGSVGVAALFPTSAAALFVGLVALVIAAGVLRQEAFIITPMLLAIPLAARVFAAMPQQRTLVLALVLSLLLLAFSDIALRHRGAPLNASRLLLWYTSGVFMLVTGFFSSTSTNPGLVPVLLFGLLVLGGEAMQMMRSAAERQRALTSGPVPVALDAGIIGLLFLEVVVALSFLPASPFVLAGVASVVLWYLVQMLTTYRIGLLRTGIALRMATTFGVLLLVISVPSVIYFLVTI